MTVPLTLTPQLMLFAYRKGVFPMARSRDDDDVLWIDPKFRGVIELDGLKLSRSLRKVLRKGSFSVTLDRDFESVLRACAETCPGRKDREDTWINGQIFDVFQQLHALGFAHSVETWLDGELVGGLYGLAIGGVFFGESMFSRASNASKIALCHLVARMKKGGYALLDTQFITDHLCSMGAVEITRQEYHSRLAEAIRIDDAVMPYWMTDEDVLRVLTGNNTAGDSK